MTGTREGSMHQAAGRRHVTHSRAGKIGSVILVLALSVGLTACNSSGPLQSLPFHKASYKKADNGKSEGKKAEINRETKFSSREFGVKASPRVTEAKKIPRGGGRYQVGKPYTVRGKTYVPKEDPTYASRGKASWYGPNFHGRLTANGEIYDQYALSAAHPTMPLPSYARVTNVANGHSVIVRVNDRGPFSHGRVIDLSSKAADLLDFKKQGVADVKVEYVGKARLDGDDERFLLASYRGPGMPVIEPGASQPGNMIAMAPESVIPAANLAEQQVATYAFASSRVPVPTPRPTDYGPGTPFLVANAGGSFPLPAATPVLARLAPLSYADDGMSSRISLAFAAVDRDVAAAEAMPLVMDRSAAARSALLSLGFFGDGASVEMARQQLSDLGVTQTARADEDGRNGWRLTMLVGGDVAQSVLAAVQARGFAKAELLDVSR